MSDEQDANDGESTMIRAVAEANGKHLKLMEHLGKTYTNPLAGYLAVRLALSHLETALTLDGVRPSEVIDKCLKLLPKGHSPD